jgi:hypothetical protein
MGDLVVTLKEPIGSRTKKIVTGDMVYTKPISKFLLDSVLIRVDSLQQYLVKDKFNYQVDTLENIMTYSIDIPQPILDSLKKASTKKGPPKTKSPGKLKAVASYSLIIPEAAIISIEGDTSIVLTKKIKIIEPTQFGHITGSITTEYSLFSIQLLNKDYNIVKEQKNGKSYEFD